MIPIETRRLPCDLDNRAGCVDLYPVGAPPAAPIRLAPPAGGGFAACCAGHFAVRAAGRRPACDPGARATIF